MSHPTFTVSSNARRTTHALLVAELMIVVTVIALVTTALLPSARVALVKTRLVELIGFVSAERLDIHEEFALNGTLDRADGTVRAGDTLEEAMGIGGGSSSELGDARPAGAQVADSNRLASLAYRRRGGVVIAYGTAGGQPFQLPMSFAVAADAPTGNLLWMCGRRAPPPGWLYVYGQPETDMPADLMFSTCREETPTR